MSINNPRILGPLLEEEILPRLTAEQVFTDPAHRFKKTETKWRGGCPWHPSTSGTSFTVNPVTKQWWCQGCCIGGGPLQYVWRLRGGAGTPRGRDFIELVRELATQAGVPFPEREPSEQEIELTRKRESRRAILAAVTEHTRQYIPDHAREYLHSRGFNDEFIEQLEIGFYTNSSKIRQILKDQGHDMQDVKETGALWTKLEGYVIFPWNDDYGRPLTFYGTWQTKKAPYKKDVAQWKKDRDEAWAEWDALSAVEKTKTLWQEPRIPKKLALPNPKDANGKAYEATKRSLLYFDRARAAGHKDLVLVEGVTDAALLQALGDTRVVACVAASLSKAQAATLLRHRIESVVICLDPDVAGENGIQSCIRTLNDVGIPSYVGPKLPDGLDPDEFVIREGIEAWRSHVDKAVHGFRYMAELICAKHGETGWTDTRRAAAMEEATNFCSSVSDPGLIAHLSVFFIPALAEATGLPLESVKERLAEEEHPETGNQAKEDSLFKCHKNGVYFRAEDKEGNPNWEWVCSPLEVRAMTRNASGEEWGRLLAVTDPDGSVHTWSMPMSMTAGSGDEYRSILKSMGLRLAPGRKGKDRLDLYLNHSTPKCRARCVSRIGWHDRRFVLPDAVYGSSDGEEVVLQGDSRDNLFQVAGSLQDWQEHVGKFCRENSRLVFSGSCALAPPLLHLADMESGGFNLYGPSSIGKTTGLKVAGSCCGGGGLNGFIRTWRTTDNALESTAAAHCDSLLCLDEMGQVDGRVAGEIAYMLGNGQGKRRAKRNGAGRIPQEWRTLFLSTGEIRLSDKLVEGGKRATAGQSVRVVDIVADAGKGMGIFEDLHGHPSGDHFARYLKEAAGQYYGTPLRDFLSEVTKYYDQIATAVKGLCRDFAEKHAPSQSSGQVTRVCSRFALVAAAGEMGIRMGILPWGEGEAREAAKKCFDAWINARGGHGGAELKNGIQQIRAFFEAHGSSRFQDWEDEKDGKRIIGRVGYRRKNQMGLWEYYVLPESFKLELCRGVDSRELTKELLARGYLIPGGDGKSSPSVHVPGIGKTRLYHFAAQILQEVQEDA